MHDDYLVITSCNDLCKLKYKSDVLIKIYYGNSVCWIKVKSLLDFVDPIYLLKLVDGRRNLGIFK